MILVIDNYDSFTHNLVHLIGAQGHEVSVVRNDSLSAQEAVTSGAAAIVLSPGPCTPDSAGICLSVVEEAAKIDMPVFGVCLGMQAIAQAFGGQIVRAETLMHGKTCAVEHQLDGIFADIPSPFTATRYHSLVAERSSLPADLKITAIAEDDNEIMAIAHTAKPIFGVQFHPESIASEHGGKLVANFLQMI